MLKKAEMKMLAAVLRCPVLRLRGGMEREWRLGGATSVCHHLVKPLLSLLAAVAVASQDGHSE